MRKKREARADNALTSGEVAIVNCGSYLKLVLVLRCDRSRRLGTYARLPVGTKLSDFQARFLVRNSILIGRVLTFNDLPELLLECSLHSL